MPENSCAEAAEPKLVFPLGRGSRGKSFLVRWLAERAHIQGRPIVVGDADRTNASLSAFFDQVVTPPSADDRDVRAWLQQFVEQQIDKKFSAIIDMGGGDMILKQIAREFDLVDFLVSNGITPVVLHLIGPDRDDLSYLRDVEHDALLAPKCTALVLNEATVPAHRTASNAFEGEIRGQLPFVEAVKRGAVPLRMPRLEPAGEIDSHRLTFSEAEDGRNKAGQQVLGPWKRQQVAVWRRSMEACFSPIAMWLP